MITIGQKISFIETELKPFLHMSTPWAPKQVKIGYEKAKDDIEKYKLNLINKESDERDYREATWY